MGHDQQEARGYGPSLPERRCRSDPPPAVLSVFGAIPHGWLLGAEYRHASEFRRVLEFAGNDLLEIRPGHILLQSAGLFVQPTDGRQFLAMSQSRF